MPAIRAPAVAGLFYPADPRTLREAVRALVRGISPTGPAPKALIVPHAAYQYSGPIAAAGFARLAQDRERIRRVILLGPSHFVEVEGLSLSSAEAFATPLGEVRLDRAAIATLAATPHAQIADGAHAHEHSLEVQLPFLQELFDEVRVVPLAVGEATADMVGRALEAVWGGPETRVVVSSDLSHYDEYETARRRDGATARLIERLAPWGIPDDRACGARAINGLLWIAHKRHLRATTLDLRNSGDTGGFRDEVVGYGAFAFHETNRAT